MQTIRARLILNTVVSTLLVLLIVGGSLLGISWIEKKVHSVVVNSAVFQIKVSSFSAHVGEFLRYISDVFSAKDIAELNLIKSSIDKFKLDVEEIYKELVDVYPPIKSRFNIEKFMQETDNDILTIEKALKLREELDASRKRLISSIEKVEKTLPPLIRFTSKSLAMTKSRILSTAERTDISSDQISKIIAKAVSTQQIVIALKEYLNKEKAALAQLSAQIESISALLDSNQLDLKYIEKQEKAFKKTLGLAVRLGTMVSKYIGKIKGTFLYSPEMEMQAQTIKSQLNALFNEVKQDEFFTKLKKYFVWRKEAKGKEKQLLGFTEKVSKELDSLVHQSEESSFQALKSMQRGFRFLFVFLGIAGLILVLINLVLGYSIYHSITGPLRELLSVVSQISEGNLQVEIKNQDKSELGQLSSAIAKMLDSLRDIVGRLREGSVNLASSAEELSATAESLGNGATLQHQEVERIAGELTQLTAVINQVNGNTETVSAASNEMLKIAQKGEKIVEEAEETLRDFVSDVQSSSEKIKQLGAGSQQITEVLELIREVADQTGLLALNAAIEAARAGEYGRGFAVVADEVRKLADRTTMAVDDIGKTIFSMQQMVKESVTSTEEMVNQLDKLIEKISQNKTAMDEIISRVATVTDMISQIQMGTQEQTKSAQQVMNSMKNIEEIANSIVVSIGEIQEATNLLARLATEQQEMAKWFKM